MNVSPIEVLLIVGVLAAIALAIFLRTPKGQALEATAKADIAKAEASYASLHDKLDKLLGREAQSVDHAAVINAAANVVAAAQKPNVTDVLVKPAPAPVIPAPQPVLVAASPGIFTDGVVRYDHHTMVSGPSAALTTEPLTGKTRASFTYTSQDPGKVGPQQAWFSENGGPEQGPMQTGVEASFDLAATSGTPSLSVRFDTDGRMIAQLFKTA